MILSIQAVKGGLIGFMSDVINLDNPTSSLVNCLVISFNPSASQTMGKLSVISSDSFLVARGCKSPTSPTLAVPDESTDNSHHSFPSYFLNVRPDVAPEINPSSRTIAL